MLIPEVGEEIDNKRNRLAWKKRVRVGGVLVMLKTLSTQVGGEEGDCSPQRLEQIHVRHP